MRLAMKSLIFFGDISCDWKYIVNIDSSNKIMANFDQSIFKKLLDVFALFPPRKVPASIQHNTPHSKDYTQKAYIPIYSRSFLLKSTFLAVVLPTLIEFSSLDSYSP